MHHQIAGIKLNRDTGQRLALLKGLAGAIIRSEAIETTEPKAKAAKILIEKLVTHARKASLTDIRQIETVISDHELVQKLVHVIAPRYKTQPGGYLRLVKLGNRAGDNAPMVRMEFVSAKVVEEKKPVQKKSSKSK